ncbi:hypothetical protein VOLCADRAFT_105881 [Volvox carteri f. nagariensis]|uniref:Phospholipid scramblase n=1 Tax=Volvox carteri f. nagariensis TaxID=3068 RepID=D8U3V0_VOLCA|nr:uncharacterized protein VOLCADRAFT_105881 [Volvox carteri f. nagariensis]EFJ45593.1 hypothetical protein VOLCADRAFT_105881 [Volvox carteri f. nagariensis]|eukprot:XP_002953283.1 hypothetical protein VOLCADRAFT_105881 [Volvox carteri f. nagariensis]
MAQSEAPLLQAIEDLDQLPGVVIKETTQVIDAVMASIGGAYEAANKYKVKALPADKRLATVHNEPGTWSPSSKEVDALPEVYYVEESSSCCLRVCLAHFGGLNLRALQLHFYQGNKEKYTVQRPCKLGGCCCCPLEMSLFAKDGTLQGMVVEDYDGYCSKYCEQSCLCTYRQKVLVGSSRNSLVHKYSLVSPMCCCGRVNNCCGATCCKPQLFIDIEEPDGTLAAVAHKTYGGGRGCTDCCRCVFDFSNYVLPFPPKATLQERVLLLTAMLSIEYAYFSRRGGENND